MNLSLKLLILLSLSFSMPTYGIEKTYYGQHAEGWHWYGDPQEEVLQAKKEDPVAAMNAVQQAIKKALDKAILAPNKNNIKDYLVLQNQLMKQANRFSRNWQATLLENPELDFSLLHPTMGMAQQVAYATEKKRADAAIRALAKRAGLFFFYSSTCPYCQRFAPIVKNFAETYHITVIPVTTDGIALPEFPHSYPDRGQAARFHVTVEPALFAVNPYTQQAIPVAYGMMSQTDLRKRILDIATQFGEKH